MTPGATPAEPECRVLVMAPTGRDAQLIGRAVCKEALHCHVCRGVEEFTEEFRAGGGIGVLAEEGLTGVSLEPLVTALHEQPPWSDFPLVLLTRSGALESDTVHRLLDVFGSKANITLLDRPVHVATLLSTVRSSLRARRRQYEVRDYLKERERRDEALLQTQKLESLGVLAGGVAHDFNNLLTGILGSASLAADSLPEEADFLRPILGDVVTASERAADLTKQLLAYAGKGRFVVTRVNLSAMVREVGHLLQSTLPRHVQLQLELDEEVAAIEADASQIQQVVMNLMINAAEAIPANSAGRVAVSTRMEDFGTNGARPVFSVGEVTPGRYIVLTVRDNGSGMDEETKARIFDPFFTTKFTGRGLGLAAVLGIVRGHKAALEVSSAAGEGSTFTVMFPAAQGDAAPPPAEKPAPVELSKGDLTVLVIDDEETVRRIAKAALERRGFQVIVAEGGQEGLELFRARDGNVDVVLLDLTMPGMGGEEVLQRLKEIQPEIKVILSSGFNEVEVIRQFTGKGLAGFLQKPYTAAALAGKVAAVFRGEAA
jgi:signal transduction histidine kinase/ActR/RegA family two-component response regulator